MFFVDTGTVSNVIPCVFVDTDKLYLVFLLIQELCPKTYLNLKPFINNSMQCYCHIAWLKKSVFREIALKLKNQHLRVSGLLLITLVIYWYVPISHEKYNLTPDICPWIYLTHF